MAAHVELHTQKTLITLKVYCEIILENNSNLGEFVKAVLRSGCCYLNK